MKKVLLTIAILILSNQLIFAQASSLAVIDTRSDITTPSSYSQSLISQFKVAGSLNLPLVGSSYYTLIGFRGWVSDNTGGKAHELAFSDDSRVFFRSGNSPSWENWRQLLVSDENGNFGVGTTDTKGYMFAVNGSAIATSMTVKLQSNWPDYVFKPTYHLPTLEEIKNYINQNHHLPDLPSEQEVAKDGINLGEIVKIQTKKIEELTLYLIDKDKQVNHLQDQIDMLKKQLDALTKTLNKN